MIADPIENEAGYDAALAEIEGLMDAAPGTPEGERLEALATLVEAYEARRWPIAAPDPVSLVEHVMEARGLGFQDFADLVGSRADAAAVLDRRLPLTPPMIRALSAEWGVPAEALAREYDLAAGAA